MGERIFLEMKSAQLTSNSIYPIVQYEGIDESPKDTFLDQTLDGSCNNILDDNSSGHVVSRVLVYSSAPRLSDAILQAWKLLLNSISILAVNESFQQGVNSLLESRDEKGSNFLQICFIIA